MLFPCGGGISLRRGIEILAQECEDARKAIGNREQAALDARWTEMLCERAHFFFFNVVLMSATLPASWAAHAILKAATERSPEQRFRMRIVRLFESKEGAGSLSRYSAILLNKSMGSSPALYFRPTPLSSSSLFARSCAS